ncbi:hypothetical protein Bca52824_033721 [Brassica carinata]|uniref:DUF4283 domain-containing protein n=1 Tax=Brassica carinata TaxID=52824 RepID=A0A8X7V6C2_BRACI|nr:hypothetical protein Bca52824_033721 [Brassica carinata]
MTRFTAEEKGKAISTGQPKQPRIRIRAPDFDPYVLIKENALTLVGRLTNPKEQPMAAVLPYLPKHWNMVGRTTGSDLGNDSFQFRFTDEEDLRSVLHNRPYQFGRWMLLIQRWEPIISASFPSQIPFWINLKGIPLHYWDEKVVRNIGMELGELDNYEVTRSSARVRVTMDGLKPLIMESILEFNSGEESLITLEYEKLGNYCSICHRLSHLRFQCPEKPFEVSNVPAQASTLPVQAIGNQERDMPTTTRTSSRHTNRQEEFSQRLDRHGKPFGDRIPATNSRAHGPRNKLAPTYRRVDRQVTLANDRRTHSPAHERNVSAPRRNSPVENEGSARQTLPRLSPPYSTARDRNSLSQGKRKRQIFPSTAPAPDNRGTDDCYNRSPILNLTSTTRELIPDNHNEVPPRASPCQQRDHGAQHQRDPYQTHPKDSRTKTCVRFQTHRTL